MNGRRTATLAAVAVLAAANLGAAHPRLQQGLTFERCASYFDAEDWAAAGLCFHDVFEADPASERAYEALYLAALGYERAGKLVLAILLREVLAEEFFETEGGLESILVLPRLHADLGVGALYPARLSAAPELADRPLGMPELRMTPGRHGLEPLPLPPRLVPPDR